jgi:hypothetical protein
MLQCNKGTNTIAMRKLFWAVLCIVSVSAAQAETRELIKGDTLRKALSGRTVFISTPLGELPVRYSANGTMRASSSATLAALAGEPVSSDTGQWWISGDKLCQRWSVWVEGKSFCYEMRGNERSISWRRNDGLTGTARIGS